AQVEVYEVMLGEDLPAGLAFRTEKPWTSDAGSLLEQLDDMEAFLRPWCSGDVFPMALGGEHGILPPLLAALRDHPALDGDLGRLTVVQIDAHADLRSQLDGEPFSHASAAARALDLGIGRLLQVGVRAHSLEEQQRIDDDARITTWFARDVMAPRGGETNWASFLEVLKGLEGPVHLTFDIDGLDGTLVPATGTPVPGGLSFWHAVQAIEAVFSAPKATVISADVNEIARQDGTPLTQFTAALVATKIVGAHVSARRAGRWEKAAAGRGGDRAPMHRHTFTQGAPN
ncbi:MAG: arginase family protein, partial [Candidatus Thermoplasmatota archaeon]|nr:arginase family protein [Candidatus Thermoplasmatota archaeon]